MSRNVAPARLKCAVDPIAAKLGLRDKRTGRIRQFCRWQCRHPEPAPMVKFIDRDRPGRWALLHRSTRTPGSWQLTHFDAEGPVSHVERKSCGAALQDGLDGAMRFRLAKRGE